MSNSDYIEEIMYKAHEQGFFKKMHAKVQEVLLREDSGTRKIGQSDAYCIAYQELEAAEKKKKSNAKKIDITFLLDDDSYDY